MCSRRCSNRLHCQTVGCFSLLVCYSVSLSLLFSPFFCSLLYGQVTLISSGFPSRFFPSFLAWSLFFCSVCHVFLLGIYFFEDFVSGRTLTEHCVRVCVCEREGVCVLVRSCSHLWYIFCMSDYKGCMHMFMYRCASCEHMCRGVCLCVCG